MTDSWWIHLTLPYDSALCCRLGQQKLLEDDRYVTPPYHHHSQNSPFTCACVRTFLRADLLSLLHPWYQQLVVFFVAQSQSSVIVPLLGFIVCTVCRPTFTFCRYFDRTVRFYAVLKCRDEIADKLVSVRDDSKDWMGCILGKEREVVSHSRAPWVPTAPRMIHRDFYKFFFQIYYVQSSKLNHLGTWDEPLCY